MNSTLFSFLPSFIYLGSQLFLWSVRVNLEIIDKIFNHIPKTSIISLNRSFLKYSIGILVGSE